MAIIKSTRYVHRSGKITSCRFGEIDGAVWCSSWRTDICTSIYALDVVRVLASTHILTPQTRERKLYKRALPSERTGSGKECSHESRLEPCAELTGHPLRKGSSDEVRVLPIKSHKHLSSCAVERTTETAPVIFALGVSVAFSHRNVPHGRSQHLVVLLADWMAALALQAAFFGAHQFGSRAKVKVGSVQLFNYWNPRRGRWFLGIVHQVAVIYFGLWRILRCASGNGIPS